MTKNSISGIFGLIREVFSNSTTRIANIYTIHCICNSGGCGVVDTSLGHDPLEWSKLSYYTAQSLFFFFSLYFTLEFLL